MSERGSDDPQARLAAEFRLLLMKLRGFREGSEGGLTALRIRLDSLNIAALAANDRGEYVAVNAASATLTGYSVTQLQHMSVWDLTLQSDVATGERLWAAFLEAREQSGSYDLRTYGGRLLTVHYFARAHVLPHTHVSLLTAQRAQRG